MNRLSKVFDEILRIEYSTLKGEPGNALEEEVKSSLDQSEFTKLSSDVLSETHKKHIRKGQINTKWFKKGLPEGMWYIHEPLGSNDKPDFIVLFNGVFFLMECKTSKKSQKITWNTSYPQPYIIYVFSEKVSNKTTIFRGTVLLPKIREAYKSHPLMIEMHKLARILDEELLAIPENDAGFGYFLRNMFNQSGGAGKTNWCTSPLRSSREKEVLDYIEDVCGTADPNLTVYSKVENFNKGQTIVIPGIGVGIVDSVAPTKIRVRINGALKPMVHNFRVPKVIQNSYLTREQ